MGKYGVLRTCVAFRHLTLSVKARGLEAEQVYS